MLVDAQTWILIRRLNEGYTKWTAMTDPLIDGAKGTAIKVLWLIAALIDHAIIDLIPRVFNISLSLFPMVWVIGSRRSDPDPSI